MKNVETNVEEERKIKWKEEYIMNYEMKCTVKRDPDNLCHCESINKYLSIIKNDSGSLTD
jgi:hypothetical protein